MRLITLYNDGLQDLAHEEFAGSKVYPGYLEGEVTPEYAATYFQRTQAARRVLLYCGVWPRVEDATFLDLKLPAKARVKCVVEGVKGQDNRNIIAKTVLEKLFEHNDVILDLKNPAFEIVVQFTGTQYVIGLDLGGDLTKRQYRVFCHQASFRGDVAYAIIRLAGFCSTEKTLFGFCKDATLPIEALYYASGIPLRPGSLRLPAIVVPGRLKPSIAAFDTSRGNVNAARKNVALACMEDVLDIQKFPLDELDVRYDKHAFDRAIFHLTKKDEEHLNEIFYQARYILKPGGKLSLITRAGFEVEGTKQLISKGDEVHQVVCRNY